MREQDTAKPTTTWGERPPIRQGRTRSVHRTRLAIAGALLLAVILVLVLASTAFAFPDVPSNHPYLTAITALSDGGVISGYQTGKFGPQDLVKRQQFAKMIVLDLGFPVTTSDICTFKDVDPSTNPADPLYPDHYVAVAATRLLVQGYTVDNTFRPLNPITRRQVITMVVRAAGPALIHPPTDWNGDLDYSDPTHGDNIRIAEFNGLTYDLVGLSRTWDSGAFATRGECAQMLYNLSLLLTPPGVQVNADGSGDYPTIEAAVANIDTGTTIFLGPGQFVVSDTLVVDFSFNLVGSGINQTAVTCKNTVLVVDSVSFSAQDLTFLCTGTADSAHGVVSQDATVDFQRCRFAGGVRVGEDGGDGLYLLGTTAATVSDCAAESNDLNGIELADTADATLTGNTCINNGQAGMIFFDDATGSLSDNTCSNNAADGIALLDNATALVEKSLCTDNGQAGIYFGHTSSGTCRTNECSNNQWGIYIDPTANPTIAGDNILHGNTVVNLYDGRAL